MFFVNVEIEAEKTDEDPVLDQGTEVEEMKRHRDPPQDRGQRTKRLINRRQNR